MAPDELVDGPRCIDLLREAEKEYVKNTGDVFGEMKEIPFSQYLPSHSLLSNLSYNNLSSQSSHMPRQLS